MRWLNAGDIGDAATKASRNSLATHKHWRHWRRRSHALGRWRTQRAPPPHCTDLNPPRAGTTGELSELPSHDFALSPTKRRAVVRQQVERRATETRRKKSTVSPAFTPFSARVRAIRARPERFQCTSHCHLPSWRARRRKQRHPRCRSPGSPPCGTFRVFHP